MGDEVSNTRPKFVGLKALDQGFDASRKVWIGRLGDIVLEKMTETLDSRPPRANGAANLFHDPLHIIDESVEHKHAARWRDHRAL